MSGLKSADAADVALEDAKLLTSRLLQNPDWGLNFLQEITTDCYLGRR